MSRWVLTDEPRNKGRKGASYSPEKSPALSDDTDAPSVSPFSLSFFKLGLPAAGYVMLVTEIIPSFIYLALSHFHIGYGGYSTVIWFNNHFYAVLFAIPTSFTIAILSDGYKYGKFIACIVMLTLMFVTSLCSLFETVTDLNPNILYLVKHVSPYAIFVFYVTLPIRVTIFTDVFAKHRTHERARKAFAAYWICNMTGVVSLIAAYQHFFELDNRKIHLGLLMTLLSLNLFYFLATCLILMSRPLELPLKNQFLYHICCIWFALRHQPPKSTRGKTYDWLNPALQKYTQTEVKRSRSLAHIMMLVITVVGYAVTHSYIYYNYYNYAYAIQWFGQMTHSYNCFYAHVLFTIIFIFAVEVAVLPISYHCIGHFNGIWLMVAGYFVTGIPLAIIVYHESTCNQQYTSRYYAPSIRLINGYPDRVRVHSDWLGPGGGKGWESIPPGEVLTLHPPKSALGSYGEATVFASSKITDFLALAVEKGHSSTYFLSPYQNQYLELKDYDVRRSPQIVFYGSFIPRRGTVIISCSPDYYKLKLELKCIYTDLGEVKEMEVQPLCTTKAVHNGVTMETRPVLTILNWPARRYDCSIGEELVELKIDIGDFASLHIASRIDSETRPKVLKTITFHNVGGFRHPDAYLVLTSLDILHCQIPYTSLVVQLVTHGLSTALVLVSAYTFHCLHGPPRMRMTSYALPHIGGYIGLCIERSTLNSKMSPFSIAIMFEVMWIICFVILTLIAVYCRFQYHSWDIPWRPSIFWNLTAWLNIRLHHRSMVKEKPPKTDIGAIKSTTGILQHDFIKDKTVDDDKTDRKVRFSEEKND